MKKIRENFFTWGMAFIVVCSVALAQDQVPEALPAPEAPPAPAAPPAVELPARAASAQRRIQAATAPKLPGSLQADAGMAPGTSTLTPSGKETGAKTTTPALKFEDSTADFLLRAYAEETGLTLLVAPDVPKVANINLRSQEGVPLTKEEYLEAIEVTLSMNGIVLEPYRDKFLKVLPRKTIRTEGIRILMEVPEGGHPEKTQVISQMIQLKSITISEAQKALEGFKRPDGMIQAFERTNSLLVTDTQDNVNRMLEIVRFIDQPLVATEEVNVRMIRFAKADDIKKRLEEIVAESQKQSQAKEEIKPNVAGAPGFTRATATTTTTGRPLPPGLTRLGARPGTTPAAAPAAPEPNVSIETLVSDADRGMIRGKVQIIADERSNQLIIITREENMNFFDKIITVLDIETAPDVMVEVQRLEYADSEEVSSMLNDLIGNASAKKDDSAPSGGGKPAAGEPGSTSLAAAVAARTTSRAASGAVSESDKSKLGQLSKDNIKILADKRTNAIVMMGSPSDIKAIKEIIAGMDIRLSQVLIETVVIQVELGDDLKTGMDWVQRGKHTTSTPIYGDPDDPDRVTGYKREVTRDTIFNNGDQLGGGGGSGSSLLGDLVGLGAAAATNYLGARTGISYFLKSDKLNIAALIEATKSDTRTKVLSSPVLMTVDNKEATLEATSMRYLYKGVRYSGSTQYGTEVPDFEQRDIGLTVKVTPRINPNGTVVLSIEETFETVGANQQVGNESYPTVNTRKVQADVSVENMQTVVLGGLVQNEIKTEEIGVPILKDIPWVGKYLFGKTAYADSRSELLVFLTPYVLDTPKEAEAEAVRRKEALSDDRPWVDYGWSKSKLADPMPSAERMRRTRKSWATEDANYKSDLEYEKALEAREKQLEKRAENDAEQALKRAKRDAEEAKRRAEEEGEDSTEAQLRVLLNKLQEKQREDSAGAEIESPAVEPAIQVSESVEVLGPKDAMAANKAEEPSERLLTPEQDSTAAKPKAVSGAKVKKPWWQMF